MLQCIIIKIRQSHYLRKVPIMVTKDFPSNLFSKCKKRQVEKRDTTICKYIEVICLFNDLLYKSKIDVWSNLNYN